MLRTRVDSEEDRSEDAVDAGEADSPPVDSLPQG